MSGGEAVGRLKTAESTDLLELYTEYTECVVYILFPLV